MIQKSHEPLTELALVLVNWESGNGLRSRDDDQQKRDLAAYRHTRDIWPPRSNLGIFTFHQCLSARPSPYGGKKQLTYDDSSSVQDVQGIWLLELRILWKSRRRRLPMMTWCCRSCNAHSEWRRGLRLSSKHGQTQGRSWWTKRRGWNRESTCELVIDWVKSCFDSLQGWKKLRRAILLTSTQRESTVGRHG